MFLKVDGHWINQDNITVAVQTASIVTVYTSDSFGGVRLEGEDAMAMLAWLAERETDLLKWHAGVKRAEARRAELCECGHSRAYHGGQRRECLGDAKPMDGETVSVQCACAHFRSRQPLAERALAAGDQLAEAHDPMSELYCRNGGDQDDD